MNEKVDPSWSQTPRIRYLKLLASCQLIYFLQLPIREILFLYTPVTLISFQSHNPPGPYHTGLKKL